MHKLVGRQRLCVCFVSVCVCPCITYTCVECRSMYTCLVLLLLIYIERASSSQSSLRLSTQLIGASRMLGGSGESRAEGLTAKHTKVCIFDCGQAQIAILASSPTPHEGWR